MTQKNYKSIARQVFLKEAEALRQMADDLPLDFSVVIDAILSINGRVIVSGVGKSGHVGRKIAATFASTGTPAIFVHATEASHGDLGMITVDDFCLLISNSGETSELCDIITHTRRFDIKMAAISSNINSTLVRAADYKLILTKAAEACSIGLAPTTSTTLTIALGDALAVALMECRNFKNEDFKVFHPGGKLGAQLITAGQMMRTREEMAILKADAPMQEVVLQMTQTGFGTAVLVDEDGHLFGVITDGDLRRNLEDLMDTLPDEIATKNPIFISPEDLISVALKKMEKAKVYSILVVQNNQPIGLVRMHDILRAGYS